MSAIAEKIAKIIAKAHSTTFEGEAETLMAKAHELLEKHNLTLADLPTEEANRVDPIGHTANAVIHFPASMHYAVKLTFALARYYGCRGVYWKRGNRYEFQFVGRESARMTLEIMWPFVIKQIRALARQMVQEGRETTESRARTAIGNALMYRIWGLIRAEEAKEEVRVASGLNALVPVDELKSYEVKIFGELKTARSRVSTTTMSAMAAAKKVSLHQQITTK